MIQQYKSEMALWRSKCNNKEIPVQEERGRKAVNFKNILYGHYNVRFSVNVDFSGYSLQ